MEPLVTGALAAVKNESAAIVRKESASFIGAVLGEPAKALGSLFADKIKARQHSNLIKITVGAKRKLAEAGVSPKEVPLSIIHPALEAASLEEDPDLQEIWANLLANAADPRSSQSIPPSFASMLRHLSSREVKFLNVLYANSERRFTLDLSIGMRPQSLAEFRYRSDNLLEFYTLAGLSREPQLTNITVKYWDEHKDTLEADFRDYRLVISVLKQQGILDEQREPVPRPLQPPAFDASPLQVVIDISVKYGFSDVGAEFVAACQPPKKVS